MIFNFLDISLSALKIGPDATAFGGSTAVVAACLQALVRLDPSTALGVYAVDQVEGATITVFNYTAKTANDPAAILESHRDYADIHVCLTGNEAHALYAVDALKVKVPWQQHNDAVFYEIPAHDPLIRLTLSPGAYVIYFPGEAHLTQLVVAGEAISSQSGMKAVLKLPKAYL